MDDNSVAGLAILMIFGLPVGGWIISRVLAHRERMAMLQHGIAPPDRRTWRAWRRAQRHGGGWTGPPPWTSAQGAQPWAGGAGASWSPGQPPEPDEAQCMLRSGIKTTSVGFALLIGLSFIGYHSGPLGIPSIEPGPWLLGGLIPMFVGIAQIIIAVMSGAVFMQPRVVPPAGPTPPNGAPGPAAGPAAANGTPTYTGYPGQHYEQLARPVPPPDQR